MIFVGIDWSSLHDDVCILDEMGEIIKEFRIPVSGAGFRKMIEVLDGLAKERDQIYVGIESGIDLAAKFLTAAGCTVYNLNPLSVNRFKERYTACAKKDDRFDAMNIASMLYKDRGRFTPVQEPSSEVRSLQIHCETLDDLIRERTRAINQLKSCLMRYFPAFTGFFTNFRPDLPHHMLTAFPRPGEIASLPNSDFLLRAAGIKHMSEKRKTAFHEFICAEAILFENPDESALADRAVILARRILALNETIAKTEAAVKQLFDAHPMAPVFNSLPGAGERIAPNLLACFGDNRARFCSPEQVQCYAGTAPITKKSGKSFEIHRMRRACSKHFRYTLYTLSFTSLKYVGWVQEHYAAQKGAGKTHSAALRSVSNKWAKILYSMRKNGTLYDEARFMEKKCRAA